MYPKKLGIFISFSSAIDLTMKFGAFPIYVKAPKKTAPVDIANNVNVLIYRSTVADVLNKK